MSGLPFTIGWIADAVGGRVRVGDRAQEVDGIAIDSRTLQAGELYVALRGPRFDGHLFVDAAVRSGAVGAIVDRASTDSGSRVDARAGPGAALIDVADTTRALQALAHAVRVAAGTRVVAITGSAGKTTTKEAIAEFLSARFRVVKNRGNLNNHIGLPLSLMQLREQPDVAVMELGMNHAGEISALVAIAEPDVRVWTNVGDAHIGFFESPDAIADAKAEILEGAGSDSLLVFNADDERVSSRASRFPGRMSSFGVSPSARVRACEVESRGIDGIRARVVTPAGETVMESRLLGLGNLSNLLAATAVAIDFGVPLVDIAERSPRLSPTGRRGVVHRLAGGVTLIDDSYNSSPAAVRRALEVVADETRFGRKIAILGEMLELGEHAVPLHEEAGRAVAAAGVHRVVCIGGEPARALAAAAVAAGVEASAVEYFETSDSAAEPVAASMRPGDLVLVKGSRGTRTDLIVDRVMAECA